MTMAGTVQPWSVIIISYFIMDGLCFHVELRAPRYAMLGGSVVLKCDYNVSPDQLHKVEWLKGGRKIFQFVKGRTPPFRNYSTVGAVLDWGHSSEKQIMLKELEFEASGIYSCEVSTDTPIYTKPSDDQELIVMQGQLEDPHINFGKSVYMVGETLLVNCTSGPARPTPFVTWLVNGKQAEESNMKTYTEDRPSSVTVQLRVPVLEEYLDGLQLTCLSTIPAYLGHHARHSQYADHRQHAINVEVIPSIPEPEMSESRGRPMSVSLQMVVVMASLVHIAIC